jgi:hypothetical protein
VSFDPHLRFGIREDASFQRLRNGILYNLIRENPEKRHGGAGIYSKLYERGKIDWCIKERDRKDDSEICGMLGRRKAVYGDTDYRRRDASDH